MTRKKQFLALILLIAFIMLPNLLLIFVGEDSVIASFLKKGVFFMMSLAIVLFPLSFLKPKYYGWIVLLLFPFILFEASYIFQFKAPTSEEVVATLFLTNLYESSELIKGNVLLIPVVLVVFISLFWLTFSLKKDFLLTKKQRKLVLLFSVLILSILYGRNFMVASKLNSNFSETLNTTHFSLSVQLHKIFPLGFFLKMSEAYDGVQMKKKYKQNVNAFRFKSIKKDTLKDAETYILVVGETARKHNFSLYGYDKKTSPNLDTISNVLHFTNVITASNLTSISIPFILTRSTPKNLHPKFNEPAVLNAFKEAGFKTYWISNQSTGVGSVFGFYSSLADEYKNTSVSIDVANYDETLFPVLENILNDTTERKKFIVIHTLGSHFRYNYRHPEEFNVFRPSLDKKLSLENSSSIAKKDELINSYDNSILYTDYVIGCFIKQLKKQKSTSYLYYISDHGENLYDDEQEKLMHGYINPTKYEIEIPLILWTSDAYQKNYPQKIENLQKNKNAPISTVNTFHTLLDLSHISYKTENLTKSFANKNYDAGQNRYFYKSDKTILKLDNK